MVIINVKVKTLDSRNHDFTIDEEITVKEFKEHISEKVEITADLQRLIYCGRVLNDDKPLKEYDVNGKCLHLVQRPPPSSNGPNTSTTNTESDSRRSRLRDSLPDFENLMMGSFSIPVAAGNIVGPAHTTTSLNPSSTLCGNRITVARHMLQCADNIAAYLENPENGLNNQNMDLLSQQTMESTVLEVGISAVTDVDLPQQDVQNIVQAFQGAVSAAFRQNGINNITVQHNDPVSGPGTTTSSSITIEFPPNIVGTDAENSSQTQPSEQENQQQPSQPIPQPPQEQPQPTVINTPITSTGTNASSGTSTGRRQQTSTQTLGEVIGQMRTVQRRLDPFIEQYYDILQNDPTFPDETARENAQRIFDRVSEALHYMSHAQHAISDLMLDLNLQTPRHLCCRPILVEQSAFVSSGISALPPVGSINIGPLFARGNVNLSNNNQPGGANQGPNMGNTNNNNNNNNTSTVNNNNNNPFSENVMSPPSIFSAFAGLPITPPQQLSSSFLNNNNNNVANSNNNNNNNNQNQNNTTNVNSSSTTSSTSTTASSGANQQGQLPRTRISQLFVPISMNRSRRVIFRRSSDLDDAGGDDSPSDDITGQNRNANNNERYRNLLQSIISSAGQPNAEVHIINANISIPVLNSLQNPSNQNSSNAANASTAASSENTTTTTMPETTQARVTTNTQPTTSTQTRSTSRPILTSTTLPPTSIRNFRPIPANNFLSSFDRFLPCNSHHIRDDQNQSQQQQQQNQQTQTSIHVRPQRRTVSLDRNSLRQPPATATIHIPTPMNGTQSASSTVANRYRHFSGVNNITDDELNHRFNVFGIQLSLRDLDSLTPNFFNSQRDGLRAFLMQNYFCNSEINEETTSNAIRDILAELEKYLERLSSFQHPDYDVRKSIENLIKKSLPCIINLIVDDESSEFGIRIERSLVTFFENVYMILVKCIGIKDTEKYLNDVANLILTGEVTGRNLSKFPAYIIQTFLIERRSYDLSEIQEFLVVRGPSPPTNETPMEVDDENMMEDAAMNIIEEEVDDDSNNAIQQEDLINEPLPIIERSEPWHAQFPTNWLPIITRDISRQRRQSPQPPYSDAYITGMSSKRRKVLLSKKPSTNVQHLIAEDVRNAIHSNNKSGPSSSNGGSSSSSNPPIDEIVATISNDPTIQKGYKDEVKGNINQRLKNDPDFEPDKYPNSSKYFK